MIKFQDPSTFAAARAHVSSLRWRIGIGALFALGASFVLNSAAMGFGWFLAVLLSTGFDAMLGHSYLEARGKQERRTSGVLFVWGCAFSIIIFSGMTLWLASAGGGPGRVLAVLMAASSIVSVMLFLYQAPGFLLVTAAPAAICLLVMPFVPFHPGPADQLQSALGAACGVAGFLAFVTRAALYNGRMMSGLRDAHRQAKERQLEAEAKRAEAEEANRAKSEFLAVMTHELRTPLNAVIGYAEIINEDLHAEGRNDLADDASRITGSARHLLGLIDQILNLSSIDAGADGLQPADFSVRKLVDDAVATVQEEARAAGNRISVRVAADAEFAHTDAGKVTVCLAALLSNAVKFTEGGLVAVTAEREDLDGREWLALAVSDTGLGIAPEDLPRVFMPFTQLDSTATRAKGGMGLGLSIALRLAHTLGGDLTATSQPGAGSTFTLRADAARPCGARPAAAVAA
ncbi:MAG: HAMP domain-containing sensor histidine kinase [Hyphomonadaceae bacterium]